MSLRKIPFVKGEYYHIYNRGNSKRAIFHDRIDYERFLKLLFLSNSRENFKVKLSEKDIYNLDRRNPIVSIGVYCLMPNHFHLLLTQKEDGGISKFMQKLSTGYSMYYNIKYDRVGTLFEGKFKSEHVDEDNYLKYLFSYIHLNPIKLINPGWKEKGIENKAEVIRYLEKYQYSSYLDYLSYHRVQGSIIDSKSFPEYFSTRESFKEEVFSWLDFKKDN